MKKLFLAAAVAVLGVTSVNAQKFGVKAGMNVASISESDMGSKIGFNAGFYGNFAIAEKFSIQPELLYNDLGAKEDDYKVNLGYIAVPVMFQYKATPEFYLEAEPEFGFLVSAKAKEDGDSYDIKDGLNTFNFGVGIGAGYMFTPKLGANIRYIAGASDIIKDNDGDASRNNVFQVGLSYSFK